MNRKRARFRLYAGAALVAGLLLRLWFVAHLARVAGDSLVYGDLAKNWLQSGIYGFGHETTSAGVIVVRPTLIRLPGYPMFLATCFRLFGVENYRAVLHVQVAADLLTCWLASALAGRLFGSRAALVVLWLAALCPFTANYAATPLTETLVLTTIALAFYGFARWQQAGARFNRWLWVTCAALAYSLLLRPEQSLLAVAVVPAMLWAALAVPGRRMDALRSTAPVWIAALCVIFPLVPWTARNWHTFGVFEPLAPRSASDPGDPQFHGFNRWYRTWAIEFASTDLTYWNYDGNRMEVAKLPARAFALGCLAPSGAAPESLPLYAPTAALFDDYNDQTAASWPIDDRFDQLARRRIRANPICYYAALPIARVLNMMFRPRVELMPISDTWWKFPTPPRQTAFAAAYAALNLAYFLLAFAGLLAWRRRGWAGFGALAGAMAAAVALRLLLLLTLDNSEPRYTLELFPTLLVWAGALFASPSARLATSAGIAAEERAAVDGR
jgi:4-amino-4-deoxy-L-arabinose transferase-like glycosyltransferase